MSFRSRRRLGIAKQKVSVPRNIPREAIDSTPRRSCIPQKHTGAPNFEITCSSFLMKLLLGWNNINRAHVQLAFETSEATIVLFGFSFSSLETRFASPFSILRHG